MGKQFSVIKEVSSPSKRNANRKEYQVYISGTYRFSTFAKQLAVKIKNKLNAKEQ